jgi:hypothetical protein
VCGRYVSPDESAIEREFTLVGPRVVPLFPASFNVAPTQLVPVIRMHDGRRELVRMRFGLIPFFAKGHAGQYSTINARVETVRTSPAYRTAWKRGQRCLVIASGFYEWQVVAGGKQPGMSAALTSRSLAAARGPVGSGGRRADPLVHHHHIAGPPFRRRSTTRNCASRRSCSAGTTTLLSARRMGLRRLQAYPDELRRPVRPARELAEQRRPAHSART